MGSGLINLLVFVLGRGINKTEQLQVAAATMGSVAAPATTPTTTVQEESFLMAFPSLYFVWDIKFLSQFSFSLYSNIVSSSFMTFLGS